MALITSDIMLIYHLFNSKADVSSAYVSAITYNQDIINIVPLQRHLSLMGPSLYNCVDNIAVQPMHTHTTHAHILTQAKQ